MVKYEPAKIKLGDRGISTGVGNECIKAAVEERSPEVNIEVACIPGHGDALNVDDDFDGVRSIKYFTRKVSEVDDSRCTSSP